MPVNSIQAVALHEFREELDEGPLVVEAFQACYLSIDCKYRTNLAIYQSKGLPRRDGGKVI